MSIKPKKFILGFSKEFLNILPKQVVLYICHSMQQLLIKTQQSDIYRRQKAVDIKQQKTYIQQFEARSQDLKIKLYENNSNSYNSSISSS